MLDPFSLMIGGAAAAWAYSYFTDSSASNGQVPEYRESEMMMMVVSSFLYCVAEADGQVCEKEENLIRQLFREGVEADGGSIDSARLEQCLAASRRNDELQNAVIGYAREDQGFRMHMLRLAWRVAAKDGKISDAEIGLIGNAAQVVNATEDEFMFSLLPYVRQTNDQETLKAARDVLGVDANASATDIKRKYRELSNKYHPDKFVSENAVVKEMASEKFRQLTEAYELLVGHSDKHEYVLSPEKTGLLQAVDGGYCRCYFCLQKCRLPAIAHIETARCGKCQALLAFNKEMGQALYENVSQAS